MLDHWESYVINIKHGLYVQFLLLYVSWVVHKRPCLKLVCTRCIRRYRNLCLKTPKISYSGLYLLLLFLILNTAGCSTYLLFRVFLYSFRCFEPDADSRASASELLGHDFLREYVFVLSPSYYVYTVYVSSYMH